METNNNALAKNKENKLFGWSHVFSMEVPPLILVKVPTSNETA